MLQVKTFRYRHVAAFFGDDKSHVAVKTTCSFPGGCTRVRAAYSNYCREHRNEYAREWRTREKLNALHEGIELSVRFLADRLGARTLSGRRAAQLLEMYARDYAGREK